MNSNEKAKTNKSVSAMGHKSEDDGITHINIYTKAKTPLGVKLSHFVHTPFVHPYYGPFYSMEGLWYYLRSKGAIEAGDEQRLERLRYLSGYRAKLHGKQLPYGWYEEFKEDIIAANYQKIIQTAGLADEVAASTLPFDHYYTFGNFNLHVTPNNTDWLCAGFEEIRKAIKEGVEPQSWINAQKRYANA